MDFRNASIVLTHAFIGWMFCAATMGIGMAFFAIDTALIIHAVLAPVFFFAVSRNYFGKGNRSSPLKIAAAFTAFVILVDFFIVALIINRSLDMFTSVLGTWIPFALIFLSTVITGMSISRSRTATGNRESE